jgi:monooxygenase
VQRSIAEFPKQGSKKPWRLHQNYALDILNLRYGALEDGVLEFAKRKPAPAKPEAASAPAREMADA